VPPWRDAGLQEVTNQVGVRAHEHQSQAEGHLDFCTARSSSLTAPSPESLQTAKSNHFSCHPDLAATAQIARAFNRETLPEKWEKVTQALLLFKRKPP